MLPTFPNSLTLWCTLCVRVRLLLLALTRVVSSTSNGTGEVSNGIGVDVGLTFTFELARQDSGWGITGRAELWSENLSWVFSEISDVALCLTCVYGNRQQPSVQHQLRVLVFRLFAAKRYSVIQYRWTVSYCMSIFSVGSYTSSCIVYIAI